MTNEGNVFYFLTTLDAPKKRVVKYDLDDPSAGFVQVIAESKDVLEWDLVVDHDKLVLVYLQDVKVRLFFNSLSACDTLVSPQYRAVSYTQ
jgi:prolyl oligopeptidase